MGHLEDIEEGRKCHKEKELLQRKILPDQSKASSDEPACARKCAKPGCGLHYVRR